ncbi:probable BOI-related E3 ubiquitin-protein ligase 2 isoform X2 [Impatiens glandulifera]|uniref:probable BOI-related E3 ubiquitin-protein ligase 2 isoform X2 n=1 Tax=Impatiens glandulifera TaxID=253017 RepID=UPI001FB13F23|nr:probable BOI-related E3 ubiquitin-protein ligase 2 isoform X2 [Impatiens glandulifera]
MVYYQDCVVHIKMMGSNNNSNLPPIFIDDNQLQYHTNASNQLQLFGNLGYKMDSINYFGNDHNNTPALQPNKRSSREAENISLQQKLQISLNYNNMYNDETDRSASIPIKNPVSTGLRLSYDDDERNSSVTSASGSMTVVAPSMMMSLGDHVRNELDRQNEELDQYIKIQEENLAKGVRDMKQRHMASFLSSIEKGVTKKLREKDMEIEGINRKNKDLVEKIKQVASEAQNWHYRAKYNESIVNVLKNNLQHAISQGAAADQAKEGFGDSEADDAASYIPGSTGNAHFVNSMICRGCKKKEVCMLLIPCRHLSMCKDCDGLIGVCPVCQSMKTDSVEVYLS